MVADRFAVWNEITGRRLNRRLGQDVSSKPRLITPNHHIGQLGWLTFDNAVLETANLSGARNPPRPLSATRLVTSP